MRVGFGVTVLARCLVTSGVDGIGSYTRELTTELAKMSDISLLPVSFGYPIPSGFSSQSEMQSGRYASRAAMAAAFRLPFPETGALRPRIDLFHATDHLIPRLPGIPTVATLMDTIPLSHPEWVRLRFRGLKNALWRSAASWASHIITISEYSKQEIQVHFGVDADRITTIPLGVDESWFTPLDSEEAEAVRLKHRLPEAYFLFVGTIQPRKNLQRLVDAHRSLPEEVRSEVPLLIVGRAGWQCEDLVAALETNAYGATIRWLKHLPDDELRVVVKSARALVFPSLYEGFGLPVLEAFAANVPVITSNATSLPEVAGEAAILVDPIDVDGIASAMQKLVSDDLLAQKLRQKGLERARRFTWQRTAELTAGVYRRALTNS